jgi:hypothetical protein
MLAALPFWSAAMPAAAVTSTWSTPLKISGATRHAWFPDIAADDAGTVHVVWAAEYPTPPRLDIDALWYTRGNGQSWSTPSDLAVIYLGDALRNSIAVDSARRLHMMYRGFGQLEPQKTFDPPKMIGPEDVWYTGTLGTEAASVKAWLPSTQLTRGSLGYFSDLEIDSHGVLHAIWTEADQFGWGLYYSHSSDGGATWSNRVAIDDRDYVWWYRTRLTIDAQDRLHVTWEVTDRDNLGHTRAAFYARSIDGGLSWTPVRMGGEVPRDGAAGATAGPQQPTVGIDGSGRAVFVYREEGTNQIFYRTSIDGEHWSNARLIPGLRSGAYRPYDVYDTVTDSAGHVHLAFIALPEGSDVVSLLHAEWDGQAWSTPDVIAAGPPFPEYPKLALSGGNKLHVVWFGGDRDSIDRLAVGVWYSSTTIASAAKTTNAAQPVPIPSDLSAATPLTPAPSVPSGLAGRLVPPPVDKPVSAPAAANEWTPPSSLPIFGAVGAVLALLGGVVIWAARDGSKSR